jgi:hypothetical protein
VPPNYKPFQNALASPPEQTSPPQTRGGNYLNTKAIVIRCESKHADRLTNVLASLGEIEGALPSTFIPAGMRVTNKTTYINAIKTQEDLLAKASTIRVDGIRTDKLDTVLPEPVNMSLRSYLLQVEGPLQTSKLRSTPPDATSVAFSSSNKIIDEHLPTLFKTQLDWELKTTLLHDNFDQPTRVATMHNPTAKTAQYVSSLVAKIPTWVTTDTTTDDNTTQAADKPQTRGPFTTNKWNSRILFHDRPKKGKTTNATAATNTNTASLLSTTSATLETNASAIESLERKFQQQLAEMAAKFKQKLLEQNNTLEQKTEASEARLIQALPSETNLFAQMNERLDQQTNQMTQQMTHQMTQQNMMMANTLENFMHQLLQQFGIQAATPSNGRHPGAPPFVRRPDHQSNENQPELQSNLDETSDNLNQSMQGTSFSEAQDGPTLSAFTATINGDRLSPIPPTTHGDPTTTATTAPAKEDIDTSDTSMMSGGAD